jgi:diacylglycerol kinase family enzyme
MSPSRRHFTIVRNRHAGLKSARLVAAVAAELERRGARYAIYETETSQAVRRILTDAADTDAIVAAGGDGTIRALAMMMRETHCTAPAKPARIAQTLLHGAIGHAQVARANGAPFLLMAAAGFDAQVLLRLSVRLKQQVGRAAYTAPTLAALGTRPPAAFDVRVDGIAHTATWIIVANARTYGGSFTLLREASVFDAGLHAVLFHARTRSGRLNELIWLATGYASKCPSVEVIPCHRVEIAAPSGVPSQIDGDALGFGPVIVEATSETVPLIVPAMPS